MNVRIPRDDLTTDWSFHRYIGPSEKKHRDSIVRPLTDAGNSSNSLIVVIARDNFTQMLTEIQQRILVESSLN